MVHLKYGIQDSTFSIISSILAVFAILGMIISALFFISILHKYN